MKVNNFDSLLDKMYYDLKSPSAYSSKNNIFQAAKKINKSIKLSDVNSWFRKQLTPTLHKPVKYKFRRNKIIVMSKTTISVSGNGWDRIWKHLRPFEKDE